jgi:hypothetical protein
MSLPKKDEMGGACSTHVGDEKCVQIFWLESLKGRGLSEDLGVDKRILKWVLRRQDVDWIDLAQNRDQWRALVNMIMNPHFHKRRGIS